MAFYMFTLLWDMSFRGMIKNFGRIVSDTVSLCIVGFAYMTYMHPNFIFVAITLGALGLLCVHSLGREWFSRSQKRESA